MSKLISIVIPVYNNQETLKETCDKIIREYKINFKHLELEIIPVNDCSTDNSWDEIVKLKKEYKKILNPIKLSRNFGQLGALFAGFNHAKGDAVICISADLQDPIELISTMVKSWENDAEIVICYRENRTDGVLTKIFSKFAYFISRLSYPDLPSGGFDYWLMSKRVCKMLCSFKGRHNFIQGYLVSVGFSKVFIPYTRKERPHGKSGYSFKKKIKIILDFLVDSSYIPIRFMSSLGIITAFSGLIYSLFITYAWFSDQTPFPGWAPIMIMVMVIGGIIMTMLGILGEYIWRIYDNSKDFPLFIVDNEESSKKCD